MPRSSRALDRECETIHDGYVQWNFDEELSGPFQRVFVDPNPEHLPDFAAIVWLTGAHGAETRGLIARTLAPLRGNLVIDLSGCDPLDTTVLDLVHRKSEELAAVGDRLELVVPRENAAMVRAVDLAGTADHLRIHESADSI